MYMFFNHEQFERPNTRQEEVLTMDMLKFKKKIASPKVGIALDYFILWHLLYYNKI